MAPAPRWLWGAVGLAATGAAAVALGVPPTLWLLADAVWLSLLLLDLLGTRAGPGSASGEIVGERQAPSAFSVGRVLPVRYRWRTTGSAPRRIEVRERFPALLGGGAPIRTIDLVPGTPVDERLDLMPVRRGVSEGGPVAVRIHGRLGLGWRQVTLAMPWAVTVFPSLLGVALRALPTQAARRREAGLRQLRRPGEGRLFEGLREWVSGDDTRIIDWKATARRGKPIARQYEDERRQQVLIVIDAGRLLAAEIDGRARLESVIDAALHLAHAALEHDDNVGMMVFADTVQCFVPPARGRGALRAVLGALASVEGRLVEPDYPAAFRYLATRNRKRALTVLFTDVIDRTASEALVAQTASLRPRHLPLAVTLRDPALESRATERPADVAAAYERAAAEELLAARGEALAEMRQRGVLVLDVAPAAASEAVVARYHQLKRRGML